MNYRHLFHAGNFADVFKHIILIALVKALVRKETPFCFLDTHAGVGCYDLSSESAQKTKEYENGILKLLTTKDAPELVQEYVDFIKHMNSSSKCFLYPGSPKIVKHYLRPQDRMNLCELHHDDFLTLKKNFRNDSQIGIHHLDGYQGLKAFLPPKEKRGLILIDPPYEDPEEFKQLLHFLPIALKRFETGVYAIWYPIKHRHTIDRFHSEIKTKISRPMLISELCIYPDNVATQLNGSGMLIINPPFQIDQQIHGFLPWILQQLSIHKGQCHLKSL